MPKGSPFDEYNRMALDRVKSISKSLVVKALIFTTLVVVILTTPHSNFKKKPFKTLPAGCEKKCLKVIDMEISEDLLKCETGSKKTVHQKPRNK